jgi:uncharacterized sulfatase
MKPNIVIFLSDQQRYDTLGAAGVFEGVTPNLDALADEGALYENCYSVNPLCGPARASLQSGKYPTETGNFINGKALPFDNDLLASRLKSGGYDTAYIGKWHLGPGHKFLHPFRYDVPEENRGGYDYWRASNVLEFTSHTYGGYVYDNDNNKVRFDGFRPDFIKDQAIEYIDNHKSDKPFMLFISQLEPHHQNDRFAFIAKDGTREKFVHANAPEDLKGKKGDYEKFLPDYLGACHNLDENVGAVIDKLKEKGLWDNTLFIYSSDHGCHFKTRNGEYKRSCHDASTHVPLIIHGQGFVGAGARKELVNIMDIPATALSAAGVEVPESYRGKPLDKIMDGSIAPEGSVFIQISESGIGRAIRTERYKYCALGGSALQSFRAPNADCYIDQYLYDLKLDPHENNNLISDENYSEIKLKLREQLLDWIEKVEGKRPGIVDKI